MDPLNLFSDGTGRAFEEKKLRKVLKRMGVKWDRFVDEYERFSFSEPKRRAEPESLLNFGHGPILFRQTSRIRR